MNKKSTEKTCPVPLQELRSNYDVAVSNYSKIHKKLRVLDAVDKSKLWQAINSKFPKYQILPETNWVSYIKSNILASIYTVAKGASLIPTSDEDREIIEHINIALDYIWDTCNVGYYQMQAGSNAALFNLGLTQVGWDPNISGGKNTASYYRGSVVLKNVHPLNYMRDPFAEDLQAGSYVMTWTNVHKTVIMGDPRYREAFREFYQAQAAVSAINSVNAPLREVPESQADRDYYKVFTHFVKYNDEDGNIKICEVHTLNNEKVLYFNEEIKPARFPFVELFCNLPEGDVVGTSECARILSNNIAYNIMNSITLTSEYKNQRPPKFVNSNSGINLSTFSKHGNDLDRTFIVNGDASNVVSYHQFPPVSGVAQAMTQQMATDVQTTSGIDGRYTGRDTGSVLTTGGVDSMLDRVTVIDTPKIANYENYTKELTQLILMNFVEFSMSRTYFKKDIIKGTYEKITVDYEKITKDTIFNYSIHISSELPKNKQRVAAMANTLMEKQMQYASTNQGQPDLITTEEWLQLQDLPFKEMMQKRMGIQRMADATAKFTKGLFDYAALIKNGMTPEEAVTMVGENQSVEDIGQQPPNEIPPLDQVVPTQNSYQQEQYQQPEPQGYNIADPALMQGMMDNPEAAMQQPAQAQLDPEILAKLGLM